MPERVYTHTRPVAGEPIRAVAPSAERATRSPKRAGPQPHGEAIFDPAAVCMDEKFLLGSYSSSIDIEEEVEKLVFDGYRNGFDLTQLISHRFPIEEAVPAIDIASHPKADSMKIMIEPVPGGGRLEGA